MTVALMSPARAGRAVFLRCRLDFVRIVSRNLRNLAHSSQLLGFESAPFSSTNIEGG